MRSIAIDKFGDQPTIHDVPKPEPGDGQLRVAICAAGVNPIDWKIAAGTGRDPSEIKFPLVLGFDFAGTVDAVGPDVFGFEAGDAVFGSVGLKEGAFAEYAITRADTVAKMPAAMSFEQAAAVPISAHTALSAIDWLDIGNGDRLMVVGASGGVGCFAVQIAANRDCNVIATAREATADMMRVLGAGEIIDYTTHDVADTVHTAHPDGVDALLDMVSDAAAFDQMCSVLTNGGRAVSTIGAADIDALAGRDVHALNIVNHMSTSGLERIARMFQEGKLVAPIEHRYPLEQGGRALAASAAGHVHGKLVLTVG